jgi:hypothetical protein
MRDDWNAITLVPYMTKKVRIEPVAASILGSPQPGLENMQGDLRNLNTDLEIVQIGC